MKLLIKQLLREGIQNLQCHSIKITKEIADEVNKFNTSDELLRAGGISIEALDRAAFGFSDSDVKTLMPNQLHIKWKDDLENVKWEQERSGLSKIQWAKKIDLREPIDVAYEKDNFYIEDGHHRYYAAKILKKPLNINLSIEQNPIIKLGGDLGYDDFHKCIFKQVTTLTEGLKSKSAKGNRYFKMLETGLFQHYDSPKGELSPIGDDEDRKRLVTHLSKEDKKQYREWLKTPEGQDSLKLFTSQE